MEAQLGLSGQNPFHFSHSVQIATYGALMKQDGSQGFNIQ